MTTSGPSSDTQSSISSCALTEMRTALSALVMRERSLEEMTSVPDMNEGFERTDFV